MINEKIESESQYVKELLAKLNLVGRTVKDWQKLVMLSQEPLGWIENPQKLHQEIQNQLIYMIAYPLIAMNEISKHPDFKALKDEVLDQIQDYLER